MFKSIVLISTFILLTTAAQAQLVLNSTSEDYNAPYDTLLKRGAKAVSSGKMLGVKSPALGMMFYNRAIEINKNRPEAYLLKANAYTDYEMLEDALENLSICLEVNPNNPDCMYGMFYTSFKGSKQYKLEEVPKPMMTQIFNSATAFLAVAPATGMSQEKANARIIGSSFKLIMDNKDLFLKFDQNAVDVPTEENIKVLTGILPAVIATNNPVMTAGIYDNLIKYYFNNKDYVKVKDFSTKAIATGEAYTSTYFYYAHTLYYQDKNVAEAERISDLGLKKSTYDKTLNLKLTILYEEGKKAYEAKDYTKAALTLKKYTDLSPNSERAFAYQAFSSFSLKKYPDASRALKALKKNADPVTVKIFYPNLDALIAFADKPTAVAPAIQTTLLEVEKQEAVVEKGIDLYYDKKEDESIAMLNSALPYFEQTKNPIATSKIYANLGYNYHNKKDYVKGKEYYAKSIAAGGFESGSYENLGFLIYALDKNYDEAEKVLKEGIAKYPDNTYIPERLAKMYSSRADIAYDKKDYAAAIVDYLKSVQLVEDAEAYAFLGFSYYFTQQKEKCLDAMESAKYLDANITTTYPAIDQVLNAIK